MFGRRSNVYDFNNIFAELFEPLQRPEKLKYEDSQTTLELDVPGFKKDEINIEFSNKLVVISANKKAKDNKRTLYKEYSLPYEVDTSQSSAELEDGVLKLVLAKKSSPKSDRLLIK